VRSLVVLILVSSVARAAEYTYVPAAQYGRRTCGAVPANWRDAAFDDRQWADGPVNPDAGVAPCASAVYARWRFDAAVELPKLAALMLRLRYEHGFAAYLNGVEIARRRLDANADANTLATETHGPEWDRLSLPLKPGLLRPTGNVLAVEVHPRTPGKAPFLDVELSASDGPRIVRGPYLQRLSEREVSIVFDTDLPTLGEVRWGTSESYGQALGDAPPQQHHVLRVRGLEPGTAYHYRVIARTQSQPVASNAEQPPLVPGDLADAGDAQFHTPPSVGRPLRFAVFGDVRSGMTCTRSWRARSPRRIPTSRW
jgi:hypothetical protein